ncbi:unnamed protein product, partial [Prunus brigantina]
CLRAAPPLHPNRAKGPPSKPKHPPGRENRPGQKLGPTSPGKPKGNQDAPIIVKDCSRFKIIPTGPPVVLNETPLHDSPLDSPMEMESPLPRPPRPIGRKAAKAKRGGTSKNECVQLLEQIAKNTSLRIERDLKRDEVDMAREEAFAIQQQQAQEKDMGDREMKIMAMDMNHMSPETKAYWKLRRRDVMRRKLFHDDGPSNMDWLNDENH